MPSGLSNLTTNGLWLSAGLGATGAFRRALREPGRTQERLLLALIRRNAASEYGRRWGFGRILSVREYQECVPAVSYEDLEPEIERIKAGRQGVLTEEPVRMLEKTGGSTSASKYIPYTASLKREFGAAVAPWMADLYGRRPQMLLGGAYWSVSPLAAEREVTTGGLAVGFEEDTEYFGRVERWCLERLMLTPRELPRIGDIDASRYVTLRFLLETPRLSFISVWSPSFLALLFRSLDAHADRLIEDVRNGTLTSPAPLPPDLHRSVSAGLRPLPRRAEELGAILRGWGRLLPERVWPHLRVVSCWAAASAAAFLPELHRDLPGVEIQPKGLLATEGIVSIPLTGHMGAALAVTSHFLEFVEEEAPGELPLLAGELEEGREYRVLLTTGGGLYRYDLGDRVRVVGRVQETPLVRFTGRAEAVSDLCGEKLHEERVRRVLEESFRTLGLAPRFAMLAPEWGEPPYYALLIEAESLLPSTRLRIEERVEAGLAEGHHYAYCRRLGQLGSARVVPVRDGSRLYLERCAALGQRRGSVKPVALHRSPGWQEWFVGAPQRV